MNIITGKTGQPHVTSQQQRDTNAAIFGNVDKVLNIGRQLEAEHIGNNVVRVYDGQVSMHGCISSIDSGEYEDVQFELGYIGQIRRDMLAVRYTKTVVNSEAIEQCELIAIKNMLCDIPLEGNIYAENSIFINNELDIRDGATEYTMPLYEVVFNGVNITELIPLFSLEEWHPITLTSSFVNNAEAKALRYRKKGHTIEINGSIKATSQLSTDEQLVGIIDNADNYPSIEFEVLSQASGTAIYMLRIKTTGEITISRYRSAGSSSFERIPNNTWFSVHAVYTVE